MNGGRPRWLVVCETAAVPRRTVLLVRTLASAVDVHVLCWSRLGTGQVPVELEGRVTLSRGTSLPSFLAQMLGQLREGGYAGVVAADLRLLAAALFWAVGSGGRVVYDRMEIPSVSLAQRIAARLPVGWATALRWTEAMERLLARRAWGVFSVPVGGQARRHVLRLNPNVAFLANWPSRNEVIPPGSGKPTGPFTVVHSGAVGPASGLECILDAAAILAGPGEPTRWILIGYLAGISADGLEKEVVRRGLEGVVEVRSRVPYAELASILREADVGLALLDPADPKFRFVEAGMSRKAFTYMASGVPVIANPPQGAWVAEEGMGVVVPFGDAEALARAIRRLKDDPGLRLALGEAGRAATESRYHWEAQDEAILRLTLGPGSGSP